MKKILLLALILLIGLGIGAYRTYRQMQSSPAVSIKAIRESLADHNAEIFYNLVEVNSLLEDAAQEILTAQINSELDSTTYSTQEVENIYNTRKTEFISAAKTAVEDYISSGKINFGDNLTPTQKWLKNSEITKCAIKRISKPIMKDNQANIKVEFYNNALRFNFEVDIVMEKIDKKSWRVVEAKNFDSYLSGLNRALKKKLESLNAPIREEIRDIFVMKGFNAQVVDGDEYGFSKTMRIVLKADVKTEKPLAKIIGRIIIIGRNGSEGVTPFEIDMAYKPTGLQDFIIGKTLNPFVREDADAMKYGLKKSDLHIEITEIIYMDGTSLKQLEEL